MIINENLVN